MSAFVVSLLTFGFTLTARAWVPQMPEYKINPALLDALQKSHCEKIQGKIDSRIDVLEKRHGKHIAAFNNLKLRLETLAAKLKARGYDVADLEAETAILEDKINKLKDDHKNLIYGLHEIHAYVCSHTDVEIKGVLVNWREIFKQVREDDKEIRDYFKTVIRPDIIKLSK